MKIFFFYLINTYKLKNVKDSIKSSKQNEKPTQNEK